ncbi:hypothetical protein JB92DRAFT_227219 [Gautieria morchelliformis]|nr:hypothetical protein JB92DRAFT_227219 [Gautieria morchelliformis]
MAFVSTPTGSSTSHGHSTHLASPQQSMAAMASSHRRPISRHLWTSSLARDLHNFVIQLLPTTEEMAVKEDVRKLLERLIRTIEPESRLLSFGSTANGFSLRNSDMDLCCLIDSNQPPLNASDLVTMVGDLLERETKFQVKTLPHARIPIVKLSLDPSPGLPYGISCDIGFENRLALENTRLLMSYASVDPLRVRTLVIFLKVWSKRRKINSPYSGTLSSYGYVLLVIYFLVHVKNPPVLPNLQQMPPLRPISHEDMHIGDHNIWFFDDIDLLRQRWQSSNTDSVADLLIDFFKYYSRDFTYNTGVASIRAGLLKKYKDGRYNDSARDRNRFCIEDPFETDFNVARCVTKDGLYTIRGEFMRASRILAARPERTIVALAQLCEERESEFVRPLAPQPFVPPRLAPIPAQTPYSVGSNTLRPNSAAQDRLSPPPRIFESSDSSSTGQSPTEVVVPQEREPPEHMAPKRGKWTSPPPPDDPDHTSYEDRLGLGISLATSSSTAREPEPSRGSSSSNSEILTDEDVHDKADLESVGSYNSTDGLSQSAKRPLSFFGTSEDEAGWLVMSTPKATNEPLLPRGRAPLRFGFGESGVTPSPTLKLQPCQSTDVGISSQPTDSLRRSSSGPPAPTGRYPAPPTLTPLPPSPPNRRTAVIPGSVDRVTSWTETPSAASFSSNVTFSNFTSVRTPFPLYQQASMTLASSSATSAPSNAFTAQHPIGATDIQSSSSSSSRRSSWQRATGPSQTSSGTSNARHSPTISPVSSRRALKQPVVVTVPMTHSSPSQRRTTSPLSSPTQGSDRESRAVKSSAVEDDFTHPSPTSSKSLQVASSAHNLTNVEDSLSISVERLDMTDSGVR